MREPKTLALQNPQSVLGVVCFSDVFEQIRAGAIKSRKRA
ncbi:MAG: hypothetical protein RLZZ359_479 [Actinomycetota bacterium]|jgi:hypothetical protein